MNPTDSLPAEAGYLQDAFGFIKPQDFAGLGIDPADIPVGTFAALKHPSQLPSRFGGNAYGFGLVEGCGRLKPNELKLLQSVSLQASADLKKHHRQLNSIYQKLSLLVRVSGLGIPYYLIPAHIVSSTLAHIRAKVDKICDTIAHFHRKSLRERQTIGVLCNPDDLIFHELSVRFKEDHFVTLDSLEKLRYADQKLDMVIFVKDIFETILMQGFLSFAQETPTKKNLRKYALYLLRNLYGLLNDAGTIFVIADHYTPKTKRTARIIFKAAGEEKNFVLFTHIFRTRKRYRIVNHAVEVNIFDFQKYLNRPYVEQDVLDQLLRGNSLARMTLTEINNLPYLDLALADWPFLDDQAKNWTGLFETFFEGLSLKPILSESVAADWTKRFSCPDYSPRHLLTCLVQKKPLGATIPEIQREVMHSSLIGCPPVLLAEYRDSFEYVIRTLRVLERIKRGRYDSLPQVFADRLRQPLENKNRRFPALNDVSRLIDKIRRLETIREFLNPDEIEGSETRLLKNFDALYFFGFNDSELREILYIIMGHTPMGRILLGKMNEKAMKPVVDTARKYESRQAVNLLRFCRLMTVAENNAATGMPLSPEQFAELFDLYDFAVRVVSNPEIDWNKLLDERIEAGGGVRSKIIRKILKMMNHFEFIANWPELLHSGPMQKDALADYDEHRLARIENVITLINTIEQFEKMYLKSDPLQMPSFYRRFLDIEFHGTGHLFGRMRSEHVFILLWITLNASRGEIINFNPILAGIEPAQIAGRIKDIEREVQAVNVHYLDLGILKEFSDQIHANGSAFIVGTGFQLRVHQQTRALEIAYMDMNKSIAELEYLSRELTAWSIKAIPHAKLLDLENLFAKLESFYQSHLRLLNQTDIAWRLPNRQNRWFRRYEELREQLKFIFLRKFFQPPDSYTNLKLLHDYTPSFLSFILPEFVALDEIHPTGEQEIRTFTADRILQCNRKLQALLRGDRDDLQDSHFLHSVAQKEFGPLATGIVGLSEAQIEELETLLEQLSRHQPLLDAVVKSFFFQNLGKVPALHKKYSKEINPADLGQAGAFLLQKERLPERYYLRGKEKNYLAFVVRHNALLSQIIHGESSLFALQNILQARDKTLYDAFFVSSFINLSAQQEGLIMEDLAQWLFHLRTVCRRILEGQTTLEAYLNAVCNRLGESYQTRQKGQTPDSAEKDMPPGSPASGVSLKNGESNRIKAGKILFAMERILRLAGCQYVGVSDIFNLEARVPLQFIYKKHNFSDIGYYTFEKQIFEGYRIYNTLQTLPEELRHFLLNQLVEDKVRIFGFAELRTFLSYHNQIKLLLIGLLGIKKLKNIATPAYLSYRLMSEKITKRYEAVNEYLNNIAIETIWENRSLIQRFFRNKTGILLRREAFPGVLAVDFNDRLNIARKINQIRQINDLDDLKKYFHNSLKALRRYPFHTEDYEKDLAKAFDHRCFQIAENLVERAGVQMRKAHDFAGLHTLLTDLLDHSLEIGFSAEQQHRLNDLYELRKEGLKREKLAEFRSNLQAVDDIESLLAHWNRVKWYLHDNRRFFGKEFENIIAGQFDLRRRQLQDEQSAGPQSDTY